MANAGSEPRTRKSCQINQSEASAARAIFLLIMLISSHKTQGWKNEMVLWQWTQISGVCGLNHWLKDFKTRFCFSKKVILHSIVWYRKNTKLYKLHSWVSPISIWPSNVAADLWLPICFPYVFTYSNSLHIPHGFPWGSWQHICIWFRFGAWCNYCLLDTGP